MINRCARLAHLAMALAVALGSAVPPEHLHRGDHDHPTVAHRHFSAHVHSKTEIGDADEQVVWLDDVSLYATSAFRIDAVLAVVDEPFDLVPHSPDWGHRR